MTWLHVQLRKTATLGLIPIYDSVPTYSICSPQRLQLRVGGAHDGSLVSVMCVWALVASVVWRSSLPACRREPIRDDGRRSPAGWSGVTEREARSCQSVRRRSVSGNAGRRNKTGVSRPQAVRSGLSTAGPKPHEHTGCERAAKAIDTEDNSPPGYRPERLQR